MEELNYYPVTGLETQQKIGNVQTNTPASKLESVNDSLTSATGDKLSTVTAGEKTDASMLHYHSGSMTAGTGSKAINNTSTITIAHGLGVIPSLVVISAMATIDNGSISHSYGSYDGITNTAIGSWIESSTGVNEGAASASKIIYLRNDAASSTFQCSATFDAVNIYLAVSNNDNSGGTRYYHWIAYK